MGITETHNVNVLGSGELHIVLSHGFGLDQSVLRYLVPHLFDYFRVILYNNMSAGSTNPDYFDLERYSSVDGNAYDLLAILDELQITSCIYVGHSVSCIASVVASVYRPDLFSKLVLLSASPRYLNDVDYYGGFQEEELDQLFVSMRANYKSWCSGIASFVVGGDLESVVVQEFSRTLFNMRPHTALAVAQTIFQSDLRSVLGMVTVPCHIVQSRNDFAAPVEVSEYLHRHLGDDSVVEIMETEWHLPQLSAPASAILVLLRLIRENFATQA